MIRRTPFIAAAACTGVLCGAAALQGQAPVPRIWEGVYTAAQAERGKGVYDTTCIRCHGGDLAGTTAPALKGERFFTSWGNDGLDKLFIKIRDTMPPNFGTVVDDATKVDIVAYILQANGFPAGTAELKAAAGDMAGIQVLRKGEQAQVQNFTLVQAVGCLARVNDRWVLEKTADPATTRADTPDSAALVAAAARPLGSQSYLLLSAAPFAPATHVGHKMEARGLIYRDGEDARLTLTSLKQVGEACN